MSASKDRWLSTKFTLPWEFVASKMDKSLSFSVYIVLRHFEWGLISFWTNALIGNLIFESFTSLWNIPCCLESLAPLLFKLQFDVFDFAKMCVCTVSIHVCVCMYMCVCLTSGDTGRFSNFKAFLHDFIQSLCQWNTAWLYLISFVLWKNLIQGY